MKHQKNSDTTKEKRKQPIVFVCSPLAGNMTRNIQNACIYCRFAVEKGAIPFAPHLLFTQFMDDSVKMERGIGLTFGLAMLEKCDGLWVFGGVISHGMGIEIKKAREMGLPIKYFDIKFVEVSPLE